MVWIRTPPVVSYDVRRQSQLNAVMGDTETGLILWRRSTGFLLIAYLVLTLVLGLWLARRNRGEDDYFVAGRRLSGWLAGASMAATTFSIDTPLYVAGLVGSRGLAGNWEWWSFALAHVAMAVVFAPLWRRSGVLTDAAFTELRYGGAGRSLVAWASRPFCWLCRSTASASATPFWPCARWWRPWASCPASPAAFGLTDTVWLLASWRCLW